MAMVTVSKTKRTTVIYIPTKGRIGLERQVTLRQFMEYSTCTPWLVCPPNEVKDHMKYCPYVLPCPKKGIGKVHQWIVSNSHAYNVIISDDDMVFFKRPIPYETKLVPCTDLDEMINHVKEQISIGFIHGGLSARQGNNTKDLCRAEYPIVDGKKKLTWVPIPKNTWHPNRDECYAWRRGFLETDSHGVDHCFQDCDRVNNFHFFNRKKVLATGLRFDEPNVWHDFYMTLSLITRGIPNRIIFSYCWNQAGSNTGGGCSLYRTPEMQSRHSHRLAELYPDFVKVVDKKSSDNSLAWSNMKTRKDVNVQWLKAYKHGLKHKGQP